MNARSGNRLRRTLHVHCTFWYISLPSGCFMDDVNTRRLIFLSLSKLGCGLQEFNSRKFHLHLIFRENLYIIARMFQKTRIHFKSDVFAAVAVSLLKLPLKNTTATATTTPQNKGLNEQKQSLCTYILCFGTFLCRLLQNNKVKRPNSRFSVENVNKRR